MPWPKVRTASPLNRSLALFLRLVGAAVLLYAGALYQSRPAHAHRHVHPAASAALTSAAQASKSQAPTGQPSQSSTQPPPPQHAHLELLADSAPTPGKPLLLGVLFHLDRGWHIYWQNPGDSGEPPKIAWHLPPGYRAGDIRWPTPTRLGHGSVVDYGYQNQVLLMIPIETSASSASKSAGAPAQGPISATVKYLVCADICLPGKADLNVSTSSAGTNATRALFAQAESQLPKKAPASWKISATSSKDNFTITVLMGNPRTGANTSYRAGPRSGLFIPATPSQIDNSAKQQFSSTAAALSLTLHKSDQLTKPVATLKGLLILNATDASPGTAYQIDAPVHTN
jgi:DsbC/DsbD-like thiol-disulfide interchange protein